jgi:hypothetical protein
VSKWEEGRSIFIEKEWKGKDARCGMPHKCVFDKVGTIVVINKYDYTTKQKLTLIL